MINEHIRGSLQMEEIGKIRKSQTNVELVERSYAFLVALKDDVENGYLNKLIRSINEDISADFLTMSEELLSDKGGGKQSHIPAAVLAGAIMERHLRFLCLSQDPPLSVIKENGEKMAINALVDELKKVSVFGELQAKHIRTWAGIRNAAAHGEFGQVNRDQVQLMLQGIAHFLSVG